MIVDACEQQGFQPTVSFEGKDIDAIKGLVSAGLGIALIPEITLVDSLPRLTVKKKLGKPTISRTVGIIIPSERKLLPTEVIFYEFIQELFSKINQFQKDLF
jgi:LysR family transcriptional regulator, transcription activator of glutamate synthase operon